MLWAQTNVKFRTICEVREVTVGEEFQIAFRLEGARMLELQIPNLDKFYVMGPSSSVSQSYVNGRSSQVESKIYILVADKPGKYTIGAATVKTNTGHTLKTEAFTITVKAQSNNNNANGNSNVLSKSKGAPDIGNNIFLELKASNNNPVIGEQVIIDWTIYTRMDIAQINLVKLPKADGGFVHPIEDIDQNNKYSTINGKEYISRVLHRTVIFPDKAGDITISDGIINLGLLEDLNNLTNLFSPFANTYNYKLASKPLVLKVKELSNTPANFNGTVGDYKLTAQAENNTISSDDMLRIIVQIKGKGDLKQMSAPTLIFEENAYEVFPPNIKEEFFNNSPVLGGVKTFEYMVTPLKVGIYPIKPTFSFYNTDIQNFQTQDTVLNIQVLQGKNPLRTLSKAITSEAENTAENEVVNLELMAPFSSATFTSYSNVYFLNWFTALLILSIPIATYFVKEKRNNPSIAKAQKPATQKEVKKAIQSNTNQQLQKAASLMNKGEAQAFYTEISHALKTFIAHKTELPFPNLNKLNMRSALEQKGANAQTIEEIVKTLNTCDMALYSGLGTSEDMKKVYQTSNEIINALNKQIA